MNSLQLLLEKVKLINFKFHEVLNSSQDTFNIFSLLRKEADEEHLHSMFIAELLNPKGSHKMGDVFQVLFIDIIDDNKVLKNFDVSKSQVHVEYNCGTICDETPKGGFLDILITSGQNKIGVENKIYALDQKYQLNRYLNFIEQEGALFYLTLDGKEPDNISTVFKGKSLTSGKHFIPISYSDHILNWLLLCKEKAIDHPTLRETIQQYIVLIKKLTGQSLNKNYNMEIAKTLTESIDNLRIGRDIVNSMIEAKIEVQTMFWESLIESIQNEGYSINEEVSELKNDIKSYYKTTKNNKDYGVSFNFLKLDGVSLAIKFELRHNIRYGVVNPDNEGDYNCSKNHEICDAMLSTSQDFESTHWWYGIKYTSYGKEKLDFLTFNSDEIFSLVDPTKRRKITDLLVLDSINLIKGLKIKLDSQSSN